MSSKPSLLIWFCEASSSRELCKFSSKLYVWHWTWFSLSWSCLQRALWHQFSLGQDVCHGRVIAGTRVCWKRSKKVRAPLFDDFSFNTAYFYLILWCRHYTIPYEVAKRGRLRKKGTKLHIYMDHIFVAKRIRPWVIVGNLPKKKVKEVWFWWTNFFHVVAATTVELIAKRAI